MAIPAKPKEWLEPVASLKGTGASAAEASTAIQGLDATANDSRMPQQRARLVRLQPPRSADRRLLGQRPGPRRSDGQRRRPSGGEHLTAVIG